MHDAPPVGSAARRASRWNTGAPDLPSIGAGQQRGGAVRPPVRVGLPLAGGERAHRGVVSELRVAQLLEPRLLARELGRIGGGGSVGRPECPE